MSSLFSKDFFVSNRNRLLESANCDIVAITGNGLLQRNGDVTYPYRQNSNFWYLSGIEVPDITVVFSKVEEFIILPERSEVRDVFDGVIDKSDLKRVSGVSQIFNHREGWTHLKKISSGQTIGTLKTISLYEKSHGLYLNPSHKLLVNCLNRIGAKKVEDLRPLISRLRMRKDSDEIEAITRAVKITANTIEKITDSLHSGAYKLENEILADLSKEYMLCDSRHSFEPIVASGERACTIHYNGRPGKLDKGDLVLIDTGVEVDNYAADITRTLAVSKPSKRQIEVWQAVIDVQQYAIKLVKPGISLHELEQKVEQKMGLVLISLGLINKTDRASIRKYYPHAVSHHLGLDVHDATDYSVKLSENMVITIEPGIYILDEGIGVRIEDDVLVTKSGCSVLSQSLATRLW